MVFLSRIFNIKGKKEDTAKCNMNASTNSEQFMVNANLFIKNFKESLVKKSKEHNWTYNEGSVSFDFENMVFSYFHDVTSDSEKIVVDMIDSFDDVINKYNLPFSVIDFDDEHIIIGLKA